MKKALIVIDMQKDFVSGSLANAAAKAIVMPIVRTIDTFRGTVIATRDTHDKNYLSSTEGKNLPITHCIKDTNGWKIVPEIADALDFKKAVIIDKPTFGTTNWDVLQGYDVVELVGTCTDICVVSNVLLLKAFLPELDIKVDSSSCAGVTPEKHEAALETMRSCQIQVI